MPVQHPSTYHGNLVDIAGKTYHYLTVVSLAGMRNKRAYWLCLCQCGATPIISGTNLRNGATKSCGCYQRERTSTANRRHGMRRKKIYTVWHNMIRRCSDPKNKHYTRYGGRGITFSPHWASFNHFFADVGDIPYQGATLDRIDNNAGYYPDNVRWSTHQEQANNTSRNHFLTLHGETLTVSQWARKLQIHPQTIFQRLRLGWPVERLLTTPPQRQYQRTAHKRQDALPS